MKKNHLFSFGRHLPKAFASVATAMAVTLGGSSVRAQSADEIANNRPTTNTTVTITIQGPNYRNDSLGNMTIPKGAFLQGAFTFDIKSWTNYWGGGWDDYKAQSTFTIRTATVETNRTVKAPCYIGVYNNSYSVGNLPSDDNYDMYGGFSYAPVVYSSPKAMVKVMAEETPIPQSGSLDGLTANSGGYFSSMPATNVLVNAPYWGYPQPSLTVTSKGELSWPTNVPGYKPEVSAELGTNAVWKALTNGVLRVDGNQYYYKPNSVSLPSKQGYFRLTFPDR